MNLPEAPKAVGNYITLKRAGSLIYTSGHIPINNEKKFTGKVPSEVSVDDAYTAAELCAELTLATLQTEYDLKILSPINVVGFINSEPSFTEHANVLNGFTDKLAEFFSEKATRSAVGVTSLPLNVSVEVQTIFMINE
ncbi:MAG: RidA family protein [Actinobacteria bacterium]|jgi:enamine deaminase RidA (YjgF/YER057c/UK114 family)|nr:RidA family protein [Actinomycetota bacterium]MBT7013755.1 RidA family protein [Actinomycetota bacterium]MDA9607918.1 RidA family protein [Candidatus Actinomarina sp.]